MIELYIPKHLEIRLCSSSNSDPCPSAIEVIFDGFNIWWCGLSTGFNYSPLSFLFLNVPEGISRLEWHPFSTTSSPLNKSGEISLCIKPLGDWTRRLYNAVSEANSSGSVQKPETPKLSCPFSVHAEGPYGHESNYYLRFVFGGFCTPNVPLCLSQKWFYESEKWQQASFISDTHFTSSGISDCEPLKWIVHYKFVAMSTHCKMLGMHPWDKILTKCSNGNMDIA